MRFLFTGKVGIFYANQTFMCFIHISWYRETSLSPPVQNVIFSLIVPRRYFFCGSFLFSVCRGHIVLYVSCSLMATCGERADLLALMYVMFSFVFCHFPIRCPESGVILYLSIPDLCLLPYFYAYLCDK